MSLYNMLFGVNGDLVPLLDAMGIPAYSIPRFRDVYIKDGHIIVHTRTGGGNREYYTEENEVLTKNRFYLFDEDSSYDNTYANFHFSFPPELKEALEKYEEENPAVIPEDKFKSLFEKLKTGESDDPDVVRAKEVGKAIVDPILKALGEKGNG